YHSSATIDIYTLSLHDALPIFTGDCLFPLEMSASPIPFSLLPQMVVISLRFPQKSNGCYCWALRGHPGSSSCRNNPCCENSMSSGTTISQQRFPFLMPIASVGTIFQNSVWPVYDRPSYRAIIGETVCFLCAAAG